jgi:nucleotide-binding universal stress UspA family protein
MFRTLLVPVDGSDLAESALAYATRVAAPVDGNVILLRAEALRMRRRPARVSADPASTTWLVPVHPAARMTLDAAACRAQAEGVTAEVDFQRYRLGRARAAEAILAAVRERRPDLVVISTHGRSGLARWRYGSVADQVARGADVPVMLVPATVARSWPTSRPLRILVPLDGSALAEEILAPAGQLAEQLGAELLLLRVAEPDPPGVHLRVPHRGDPSHERGLATARGYLARILDSIRRVDTVVTARAVPGDPATAIAEAAREAGADLIAMTTRGRGGLRRLIPGSVAVATLQRAALPILLVRPGIAVPKQAPTVAGTARAPEPLASRRGTAGVSDWPGL